VAELVAELLGRFLLAFADLAAINYDIVLVGAAVDLNGAEREFIETHMRTPCAASRALFGCESLESPTLLNVLAAAMRA
jgi:hypothetical protein